MAPRTPIEIAYQRSFDNAAWQEAFSVAHEPSESDQALFNAATWISSQSAALRNHFLVPELAELGGRLSIILAIAAINREFKTATHLNRAAMSDPKREGVVALDHLSQQLIPGALPGHQATATSYIETALDAAESWLFDAYRMNPETTATPADIAPIAVRAIQRYSIQYTQNHLWNQALWEGWRLHDRDGALIWMPGDRPRATLIEAWRVRQQSNFMKYVWIDMSVWAALAPADRRARAYRTVLEVRNGKHRHFGVGRPPCLSKIMPGVLAEKAGFEGSYLLQFVDEQFPNDRRLTCSLLSRAWHVINDLASLLAKSVPDPVSLTEREARSLALIVGRRELSDVLCRALKEEPSSVDAIIDFLSFQIRTPGEKGHRGIWASPLIPIPGEDRFALALAALSTSNALRKAEAWLEKGGAGRFLLGRSNSI